jgi:hypothetical protein
MRAAFIENLTYEISDMKYEILKYDIKKKYDDMMLLAFRERRTNFI